MELIDEAAGVRGWLIGQIVAFHHYDAVTVETARVVSRINARAFAASTRVGVMVVVDSTIRAPDSETRALFGQAAKAGEAHVTAMAHVVRGQGFGSAATRAMLAGLNAITRLRHPNKVFATIPEAVLWLSPHVGLTPGSVSGVVARLEELVSAPPAAAR